METSGFYCSQDGYLGYAPNFVENSQYALYRDQKDTYEYPVHGWRWFDSEEEARSYFGIPKPPPVEQESFGMETPPPPLY